MGVLHHTIAVEIPGESHPSGHIDNQLTGLARVATVGAVQYVPRRVHSDAQRAVVKVTPVAHANTALPL